MCWLGVPVREPLRAQVSLPCSDSKTKGMQRRETDFFREPCAVLLGVGGVSSKVLPMGRVLQRYSQEV